MVHIFANPGKAVQQLSYPVGRMKSVDRTRCCLRRFKADDVKIGLEMETSCFPVTGLDDSLA